MEQSSSQPAPRLRRCLQCGEPITGPYLPWPAVLTNRRRQQFVSYHPDCVPARIRAAVSTHAPHSVITPAV